MVFSSEIMDTTRKWQNIFLMLKGEISTPNLISGEIILQELRRNKDILGQRN